MTAQQILFYLCAILAVGSALGMVLNVRNTVASALSLVVTMIALAIVYLLLEAHLVAAIQIMVYAGAIVVLFLFVIMLLNLRQDEFGPGRQWLLKIGATGFALYALLQFVALLGVEQPAAPELPAGFGGYRWLGLALFTDYVLLVEMISLLLLAAIVGALVLAKKRVEP